jgi:peroxiredoxin
MKKMLLFSAAMLSFVLSSSAANPLLKVKVNGVKAKDTVYLAYYFGKNLYYADTTSVDGKGNIVFGTKKTYDPGMYAVVLPGVKYFELVMNNEEVSLQTDTADLNGKMVVLKSQENTIFFDYMHFISKKRKESDPIREKMKTAKAGSDEMKALRDALNVIDTEVKNKQKEIWTKYPGTLVAKIIKLSVDPEMPEPPKKADGTLEDDMWAYKYAKAHYWDHLDFSDPRLVRNVFYHNRLESYFKNMIMQDPDTMMVEADRLIARIGDNKEMFKYTVHYLTYTFETSKVMCMDAAFFYMVAKYYKTNKVFWLDDDKMKKIIKRADDIQYTLCNTYCHPLSMMDTLGKWRKLYDLNADYTILIFWDPECGHCKKELPKFVEIYNKYKSKGVEIYAVSSDYNEKWKKFIRDNNMSFINVSIPSEVYTKQEEVAKPLIASGVTDLRSMNFRTTFDITSTPKVFLLDKTKKIIAKQLDAEQLEKLLLHYMEKKK